MTISSLQFILLLNEAWKCKLCSTGWSLQLWLIWSSKTDLTAIQIKRIRTGSLLSLLNLLVINSPVLHFFVFIHLYPSTWTLGVFCLHCQRFFMVSIIFIHFIYTYAFRNFIWVNIIFADFILIYLLALSSSIFIFHIVLISLNFKDFIIIRLWNILVNSYISIIVLQNLNVMLLKLNGLWISILLFIIFFLIERVWLIKLK